MSQIPDFQPIDNVDETLKLIKKMEKHLPILVRPTSALVKMLRKQGMYLDRYKPLEIRNVLYMGNEGGISCDITPKGRESTPLICSLTQLEVTGNDPLAEEIKAYQQQRMKKLARLPGNERPISFTVRPRRKN
jgi:hypothetical protein